jgi:hypothetical protein
MPVMEIAKLFWSNEGHVEWYINILQAGTMAIYLEHRCAPATVILQTGRRVLVTRPRRAHGST